MDRVRPDIPPVMVPHERPLVPPTPLRIPIPKLGNHPGPSNPTPVEPGYINLIPPPKKGDGKD